jgi:hypothetical protein
MASRLRRLEMLLGSHCRREAVLANCPLHWLLFACQIPTKA